MASRSRSLQKPLSPRESEVVHLLCEDDLTVREIALILQIAENTINGYIQRICLKLPPGDGKPIRRIRRWWKTRRTSEQGPQ